MKKTHKILIIIAVAIAVLLGLCTVIVISFFDSDWKSGIDGNDINFRMPGCIIEMINGKANEKVTYEETESTSYYYENRTLFGINNCSITYDSMLGVNGITAEIPTNENAGDEFEKIVSIMVDAYSDRQGYYKDEGGTDGDSIKTVRFGTNLGAVGISVSIELFQDKIIIQENAAY